MGYSQTFVGLIVIVLGMLGLGDLIPQEEIATVVNGILQVAGLIYTWYGRFKQGNITALGFRK